MTNAIKVTTKFEYLETSVLSRLMPSKVATVETTSDIVADAVQIVGTTHEVIAAGDATDDVIAIIENLHATALVQLGTDTAGSFTAVVDIPAGYPRCVIPQVSTLASLYIKSSVASTPVRVVLCKVIAPA